MKKIALFVLFALAGISTAGAADFTGLFKNVGSADEMFFNDPLSDSVSRTVYFEFDKEYISALKDNFKKDYSVTFPQNYKESVDRFMNGAELDYYFDPHYAEKSATEYIGEVPTMTFENIVSRELNKQRAGACTFDIRINIMEAAEYNKYTNDEREDFSIRTFNKAAITVTTPSAAGGNKCEDLQITQPKAELLRITSCDLCNTTAIAVTEASFKVKADGEVTEYLIHPFGLKKKQNFEEDFQEYGLF